MNDRVVHLAMQAKVTLGRKMRLDATCVQTRDPPPTDSDLLMDSVRVLSRMVHNGQRPKGSFQGRSTTFRQLRRKGEDKEAEQMLPLVKRVATQTHKRVQENKKMPRGEKVLSLFEPQTRAVPRHKGGALVEFGRQVTLDEVEGDLITHYQILKYPEEHRQAIEAVTSSRGLCPAFSLGNH
jgi:transposase, IS5 family